MSKVTDTTTCPKCGKTFKESSTNIACAVMHQPGDCCHYGQTEVTDTTSDIDPIEALYIESPSIGLVEFRKRIESLIDKVKTEAYKQGYIDSGVQEIVNSKKLLELDSIRLRLKYDASYSQLKNREE